MRSRRALWLLLAVIALAAVGLVALQLEKEEITLPVPASGPAATNAWYGVERLLGARGVPTTSVPLLRELPETNAAILLFSRGQTDGQIARLRAWVEQGGHLLVVADPRDLERQAEADTEVVLLDRLLMELGVMWLSGGDPPVFGATSFAPPQGGPSLTIEALPSWVRAAPFSSPQLWPEPTGSAEAPAAAPMLRLAVGAGWVTVLPSAEFLDNDHLGERDHALLLWSLLQRDGPPAAALLVYRDQPPSLWALIFQHADAVLWSGATLLALWLWGASLRFGPPLPEPAPARRSLVEHVLAVGEYLWRQQHHAVLLRSARRRVLRRVLGLDAAGPPGLAVIESVAAETGVEPELVREALHGGGPHDPELFLRAVRALERLRRGGPIISKDENIS